MGILNKIFKRKRENQEKSSSQRGILLFENTSEVIRAERILRDQGYDIKVVGPPPEVRKGCDLAIEFPLVNTMGILELLNSNKMPPIDWLPSNDGNLKPVDIFHIKDFGDFLMVRAANMKITVEKASLTIVNISGGGCPDVPYLASKLVRRRLFEVEEPRQLGHTLCGYALQLAYEKLKELCLQ